MIDIKDILKYSNGLTVLYAEDDPSIQTELSSIFEVYFKKVYIANDGLEGLNLFKEHDDIDLIISDIQMPNMDGLDMVSEIRKTDGDVPVIITTAFNDESYFIRSIDCKVTRYLLKPIQEKQMDEAFYDVSKSIIEKQEYIKLKEAAQHKQILDTQSDTMSKISDVLSTPNIIFQNNTVEFYSTSFAELFELKGLDLEKITPSQEIFDKKDGYFTSLDQYIQNPINNKVIIKTEHGNKIFRIDKKEIELENRNHVSEMFLLEDITAEENLFSIF